MLRCQNVVLLNSGLVDEFVVVAAQALRLHAGISRSRSAQAVPLGDREGAVSNGAPPDMKPGIGGCGSPVGPPCRHTAREAVPSPDVPSPDVPTQGGRDVRHPSRRSRDATLRTQPTGRSRSVDAVHPSRAFTASTATGRPGAVRDRAGTCCRKPDRTDTCDGTRCNVPGSGRGAGNWGMKGNCNPGR